MKVYMTLLTCIAFCLSACTSMDHTDPDGSVTKVRGFGGKGLAKTDKIALIWNNEKSFYHGTVLAGVLGTAGASAYSESLKAGVDKAAISSSTAKHAASEQTVRQVSDNAVKVGTTSIGSNAALEMGSDPVGVMNAVKP